jgi:enoyl-CoA hydratase/3-hydroxyacyl-CoA dehydrogenase
MVSIDDINTIAVIGAGIMGREIAQVALMGGFKTVILNDLSEEVIKDAEMNIKDGLVRLEFKGKLEKDYTATKLIDNLVKELSLKKALSNADFVIEAIPEVMELKKALFRKLDQLIPEHAILATNTSTMSISEIASTSERPDKVIGCHFFTPIVVLRLIEIIKGKKTSEETVKIAKGVCQRLPALQGKRFLPILQKESPGFIVNRLTGATSLYLNWLLEFSRKKGIPLESLDADAESLAEIGPFLKLDYLGLDTVSNALNYFAEELSPEFAPGKTIKDLVNNGHLGKKTGKGLFDWKNGKPTIFKTEKSGLFNVELLMAIQLNEGCRLLEEGVVSGYKLIDDAMMAGMNLPGPFGPGKRNHEKWTRLLIEFVEHSGINYLQPCNLMKSGGFINMRK